jgi:uncharacterized protein YodC (DUF2158 family)
MTTEEQFERRAIVAALFRLCDPRTMENLKTGDTVRLKSGGPVMTLGGKVVDMDANQCVWFYGAELRHGVFRLEQLEKAEPDKEWKGEGMR